MPGVAVQPAFDLQPRTGFAGGGGGGGLLPLWEVGGGGASRIQVATTPLPADPAIAGQVWPDFAKILPSFWRFKWTPTNGRWGSSIGWLHAHRLTPPDLQI